jgi:hypothetical protein
LKAGWGAIEHLFYSPNPVPAWVHGNHFGLVITGTKNIPILVEARTNLSTPRWVSLQAYSLTDGRLYFNYSTWTNSPSRFYRRNWP